MQCGYCNKNSVEFYCLGCKKWLCADCVNKHFLDKITIYTCKKCKGECRSREEIQEGESREKRSADFYNYGKQLLGVFAYPFQGEGWMVLLAGTLFFGFFLAGSGASVVIKMIVMPFIVAFAVFSMIKVILDSVIADAPLGLPDVILDLGELLADMFRAAFAFFLCFIPAIFFADHEFLFWFFICCGMSILPMALVLSVVENEIWIMRPWRFFQAILRTIKPYSVIPLFWFLLLRIWYFLEQVFLCKLCFWSYFIQAALLIYCIHVSMRPLGLFYRVYEKDFGSISLVKKS